MIIDRIVDRMELSEYFGKDIYNAYDFYLSIMEYGEVGYYITRAMDVGTEEQVKRALCRYIVDNGYRLSICDYINSVNWIE